MQGYHDILTSTEGDLINITKPTPLFIRGHDVGFDLQNNTVKYERFFVSKSVRLRNCLPEDFKAINNIHRFKTREYARSILQTETSQ